MILPEVVTTEEVDKAIRIVNEAIEQLIQLDGNIPKATLQVTIEDKEPQIVDLSEYSNAVNQLIICSKFATALLTRHYEIQLRRDDHWNQFNKLVAENSSAAELWEDILILLKLEA